MDSKTKTDFTDLIAKGKERERTSIPNKQLQSLSAMGSFIEEMYLQLRNNQTQTADLLKGIQTALKKLDKPAQEMPDFATPIIEALDKLKSSLNLSPNISVEAPAVNIPEIDLGGVSASLDVIPQAFRDAIGLIPSPEKPDNQEIIAALLAMSEQLASIDVGTRMKPQAPNQLNVTNPDGSYIDSPSLFREMDGIVRSNPDTSGNYQTMAFKLGSTTLYTLTFVFDNASNVTSITRS